MNGIALVLALSLPAVDHAWRTTDGGQAEYVVQIEPVLLTSLWEGEAITSQLPADAKRVDRLCIRIGSGGLARLDRRAPDWPQLKPGRARQAAEQAAIDPPLAILVDSAGKAFESYELSHGWQAGSDGRVEYLLQLDPRLVRSLREGSEIYAAVLPEAGAVRSIAITAGRKALPREAAKPPVAAVAQFQAPENRSAAAGDDPAYTDLTGGSLYGGGAGQPAESAAPIGTDGPMPPTGWNINDASAAEPPGEALPDDGTGPAALQPPSGPLLEVPQFDRSQFSDAGRAGARVSRTATQPSAGAAPGDPYGRPAARQPRENFVPAPADVAAGYQEDPGLRTAARSTAPRGQAASEVPARSSTRDADASERDAKGREFPGWFSFILFCALCLSIGGNLYLGWTAAEFYSRYKLVIERLRTSSRD